MSQVTKKTETREEILRVENLKQYFSNGMGRNKLVVKAVDDISFSIYKGEVFSLVGESGCGKTTTGRSIINLYKSTGGDVYFHGTRITTDYKLAKKLYTKGAHYDEYLEAKRNLKQAVKLAKTDDSAQKQVKLYEEEVARLKQLVDDRVGAISEEEFIKAKEDRKFEKIKDRGESDRVKGINEDSKEVAHIIEKYRQEKEDLVVEIKEREAKVAESKENVLRAPNKEEAKRLKGLLEDDKRDLKVAQTNLRLINKRRKLDIDQYKRELVYKNKFLMRKMQMIFQDPIASLNPRMTVKEIIAEGLRINGVKNEAEIDRKVKLALTTVGLVPEHASRYPHEFSGGQRQRIGIARALIVEPSFIIADEPISALDVSIRAQVINLLNDLRNEQGITIMFIAHDLSVVKYFSDRVAVMYFGKIVEIGDKDKIFNNPLHPYTLSLIDAIPLPDPKYEQARGKLMRYNPHTQHNYTELDPPRLREVEPGHEVLCNEEEFERYQKQVQGK